ncbi:MAG: hypothetical protein ABEJ65_07470 [bacterium]
MSPVRPVTRPKAVVRNVPFLETVLSIVTRVQYGMRFNVDELVRSRFFMEKIMIMQTTFNHAGLNVEIYDVMKISSESPARASAFRKLT